MVCVGDGGKKVDGSLWSVGGSYQPYNYTDKRQR